MRVSPGGSARLFRVSLSALLTLHGNACQGYRMLELAGSMFNVLPLAFALFRQLLHDVSFRSRPSFQFH